MKRVSTTMMAAALLFLLSACVIEPGMNSGQKVAIRFAASNGDEAGDDIVLRSAATAAPETQIVSLGGDFFLYATLTPEAAGAAGALRAAAPLENGQKVYLSAYETGTGTHKGTVLYTYTGGNLVAEGGNGLEVETGSTYNFTAYSYYNNTTDTPETTNVDPAKDLIWGQQADKAITADDQTVSIVMTRRFARAKVRIGTTIPGAAILAPLGAVSITSSYADLSVPDGALTKGADIPHTVTFPSFTSTDSIVSNETYTVYPGVKVNIASMIIDIPGQDGTPFTRSGISLGFNGLKGGKSYVLDVSVRRRRWAWSNIYWQAVAQGDVRYPGYMAFDTTDKGHQGYQGLLFLWRSLVGSVAGTTYSPTYNTNDRHNSTWAIGDSSSYLVAEDAYYGYDATYLIDAERNTPEMYANRTGDICQYLGKTDSTLYGYRMPIANEFPHVLNADGEPEREVWDATNTTTPTEAGWLKGDGSFVHTPSAMYADGRADFLSSDNGAGIKLGSVSHPSTGLVLPASGIIYNGNNYIGSAGGGWSASPRGTREIWILNFNNTSVGFSNTPVYVSLPVRCIRKEPGEP